MKAELIYILFYFAFIRNLLAEQSNQVLKQQSSIMVCVPCIVIPLFLFLWHRYIQPFILRFWNPFGLLDDGSNKIISKKKVGIFDVQVVDHKTGKMTQLKNGCTKNASQPQPRNGVQSVPQHSKDD